MVLCNPSKKDELIKQGEAVAQIVYQRMGLPVYVKIEELPITERGNHGLGTDDTTKWLPNQASLTTTTEASFKTIQPTSKTTIL